MPAWAVTSVNWIGPEGRAGAVLGAAEDIGAGTEGGSVETELADCGARVSCGREACCLQPANDKIAASARQQVTRILGISGSVSFSLFSAFHLADRDPDKNSADHR
jgi:hypothetical protein